MPLNAAEKLQLFDREKLRKLFLTGQHWLCAEYRRVDNSGSIRWVRQVLFLAEDPATRHLHLFTFLIRLDAAHQLGHAIRAGSLRDPVTRLFRREAVRQIAEELFSRRKGGNRAVAVLQADGLPAEAPDAPGPDADRLRYDLAAGLSLALGGSCVLGRYGADQLSYAMVFTALVLTVIGSIARVKSPETAGSPGAPQPSTTFHQVIPIIGSRLNQSR